MLIVMPNCVLGELGIHIYNLQILKVAVLLNKQSLFGMEEEQQPPYWRFSQGQGINVEGSC